MMVDFEACILNFETAAQFFFYKLLMAHDMSENSLHSFDCGTYSECPECLTVCV